MREKDGGRGEGVKYNNCFYLLSVCHRIIKQIVEVPKCKIVDVRLAGNSLQVYINYLFIFTIIIIIVYFFLQYDTLVTIVGLIQESRRTIKFDLFSRAQYLDPDRMERTVYVSPIAANVTPEMLKVPLQLSMDYMIPKAWACCSASANRSMPILKIHTRNCSKILEIFQ